MSEQKKQKNYIPKRKRYGEDYRNEDRGPLASSDKYKDCEDAA